MKKNNYLIIFSITLLGALVACGGEEVSSYLNDIEVVSKGNEIVLKGNISLSDAKQIAMQFMSENNTSSLRTGKSNEITSIELFIDNKDTLLYLMNFTDGFTLISGSSVTYPILAFADQNNIYKDDIKNNSELMFWIENMKEQIKESLSDTAAIMNDPLSWENTPESLTRSRVGQSGKSSGRIGEELCLIKTNWSQGPPFNNFCPSVGSKYLNGKAPAGCVAIAIGQIIFYHKKFSCNYTPIWSLLEDPIKNPDEIAKFIKTIGDGVSMVYKKDGSYPALATKIGIYDGPKDFLKLAGYNVKSSNFSLTELVSQLDKKNPVYISGYKDTDIFNIPNIAAGHAWVCDGYEKVAVQNNRSGRSSGPRRESSGTRSSSTYSRTIYYLHFNWGWDGTHNGWFADGETL
ncbi:MAG: C10 family peptidase, partial [Gallicola sp.]|nr:C10 family peptidase [Gallicola sp.]